MLEMLVLAALAARASKAEIPPEDWTCANQIEVWCSADGCAATSAEESTPLSISASSDGRLSVCAYSGCWEGLAAFSRIDGRRLWTARALPFTSGLGASDVTLLIEADGVGFVRAGGLATPALCSRTILPRDE